jgi:hypothetical protein
VGLDSAGGGRRAPKLERSGTQRARGKRKGS